MNLNAIVSATFLPLLYWTGAVIAVTMFGYPGVACTTPLAWLLALPVGFRLARESSSPQPALLFESLAAGGALGVGQGLLAAGAMSVGGLPTVRGEEPGLWLAALVGVLVSAPVTAGLAALAAWWRRKK